MNKQMDFTQGNIFKMMLLFSAPIFLTNILQVSYQVIDGIWVGQLLGSNALGAISISGPVIFTVLSFIIGINSATLTVLSQQKGKKDEKGLKDSLNAFVVILFILASGFGIIGFSLTDSLLRLLGTPEEIFPIARSYLHINFLGIIFLFGYNFIGTILRAMGDSKTPIRFVLLATILNAILDPILIKVLNLGIEGAAYATVISQGTAFVYGLFYSYFKANVPFSKPHLPSKPLIKSIFKIGLPSGIQMIAVSGGLVAIISVVTSFGETTVAGFGAAQRLERLILIPAFTLGSAVTSMAGQNLGIKDFKRVGEIAKNGIISILIVMFTISSIVFLLSEPLVKIFITDKETVEFGTMYLKTIAFFYPFLGINFVLNSVVRASGAMFQVLVLNLISFWVLRFPFTYLFAKEFGEFGIALGSGLSLIFSSFFAIGYYKFGNWRKTEIFKKS